MQSIRNWSQSWMAWALVLFICGTFALFGISSYFYGDPANKVMASVNGKKITAQQLARAVERMERMEVLRTGKKTNLPQAAQELIQQQILQQLVTVQALAGAALNQGFNVPPEQARAVLTSMPAFQVNGQFSPARFQEALSNLLYTPQEFLENLKRDLLVDQIRAGFTETNFALPNEVEQAANLLTQERTIRYLILPLSSVRAEAEKQLTEEAIKAYYNEHQAMFSTPAQAKMQYLRLSLQEVMKSINVDEASLKQYYQSNREQYTQPARWQISVIRASTKEETDKAYQALQAGKSSEGLSKPNWYLASQLEGPVQEALKNVHTEALLKPIALDQGFVIVKVLGYKPEHLPSYQEIAAPLKATYLQQQAKAKFSELSEQLADSSFEHPNSLEPAAKKLGLKIQETTFFTEKGGKESILQNEAILKAAFSPEVFDSGNNSDLIQVGNNDIVVVRIINRRKAGVESLASVQDKIKQILLAEKARALLKAQADNIIQALETESIAQVLAKHHLTWQKTLLLSRNTRSIPQEILLTAFSLPKSDKEAVAGVAMANGDYALVNLIEAKEGGLNALSKMQGMSAEKLKESLSESYGVLDFDLYVRTQLADSKIK